MSTRFEVRAIVQSGTQDERPLKAVSWKSWTLANLVQAGPVWCSPIDQPAPRWSAYVFNLPQDFGFSIVTMNETHSGPLTGTHSR